jgi:tRNA (cytidine/uridine-2'-O-)-methyltransferase
VLDSVKQAVPDQVCIPMQPGTRSLNVAVATAMITGEALRQTHWS